MELEKNDLSNVKLQSIKPINTNTVHKICSGQVSYKFSFPTSP